MLVSLTIVRYRKAFIPFALLAMAVHRIPLSLTKGCTFWKLMGCGKNGTFDINPDWQQWGLLAVWASKGSFERFIANSSISSWWQTFTKEQYTILCEPLSSHGKWDGKEPFGNVKVKEYQGPVAVLTRASIRLKRLKNFWQNVDKAAANMTSTPGYLLSFGIGEAPLHLQATFSVWENVEAVKNYAYASNDHREVIKKTREENWYSEELFARFKPLATFGTINGIDPLAGKI
ncbi:DUF3291 domain-containing protein [Pedobacter sp. SYSU D00535]|uniref:DUF3291 domain-containing protein n=1 Tax=Pedobacter sp. SYSU D00535 TaxID=2810308 RepID=UPI001A975A18|nr:DUF3291 domain-containing protein [Pedobacter sp. SYSU D00535]